MHKIRRCEVFGKLSEEADVTNQTSPLASTPSSRLFIVEKKSGTAFLIDTGSDVSVLPAKDLPYDPRRQRVNFRLNAPNGTQIKTHGYVHGAVDLGLARTFNWNFVIADVLVPIIGADFLKHYHLLPDLNRGQLFDGRRD